MLLILRIGDVKVGCLLLTYHVMLLLMFRLFYGFLLINIIKIVNVAICLV